MIREFFLFYRLFFFTGGFSNRSSVFYLILPRIRPALPNIHGPECCFEILLHQQTTTAMIVKLLIAILIASSVHLKQVVNALHTGRHFKPNTSTLK
ncbi:hypothetical protein BEL04_02075 [Mucilaginibacter sp. PPCGB 2223]|nr:hypothetical protein BEL04_02075 [Mucilaginibacter sp. PPCGB 2223]